MSVAAKARSASGERLLDPSSMSERRSRCASTSSGESARAFMASRIAVTSAGARRGRGAAILPRGREQLGRLRRASR